MNIKLGDREFIDVDYWWEGDNFIFKTKEGERYELVGAYPISMKIEGLDCTDSEEVTIECNQRWEKGAI